MNCALPLIKLNNGDNLTPFEMFYFFYYEIRKLLIEDQELEKVKADVDTNKLWNKFNISKEEHRAWKGSPFINSICFTKSG